MRVQGARIGLTINDKKTKSLSLGISKDEKVKSLLELDYADDLSILDESVSKINELLEVLQVQGARIGLKINVKRTKSLAISEDEKVMLGNEKIDQVGSFA